MAEIPRTDTTTNPVRTLARLVEPIHSVCYYAPEIGEFNEVGFRGWWHAYFGYRSAPMGRVSAATVTAVFYNFAPRMVERAVPSCWEIMEPRAVREKQNELTGKALNRSLGEFEPEVISGAANTLRQFADQLPTAARPLYAGWASEAWPEETAANKDLMTLWHGCSLLREFRFDGHNAALFANDLDPVESHVMMVSHGHSNGATIQTIRGWTAEEWNAACDRLAARGWIEIGAEPADELGPGGEQFAVPGQTPAGTTARKQIEADTDRLSQPAGEAVSEAEMTTLLDSLGQIVAYLIESGEVAGVWPPPHVIAQA